MAEAGARAAVVASPAESVVGAATRFREEVRVGDRLAVWPVLLLVFGSGLTALVYEVLWLEELALLLGSTSRSAALTLSVFFLGLSIAGWSLVWLVLMGAFAVLLTAIAWRRGRSGDIARPDTGR